MDRPQWICYEFFQRCITWKKNFIYHKSIGQERFELTMIPISIIRVDPSCIQWVRKNIFHVSRGLVWLKWGSNPIRIPSSDSLIWSVVLSQHLRCAFGLLHITPLSPPLTCICNEIRFKSWGEGFLLQFCLFKQLEEQVWTSDHTSIMQNVLLQGLIEKEPIRPCYDWRIWKCGWSVVLTEHMYICGLRLLDRLCLYLLQIAA